MFPSCSARCTRIRSTFGAERRIPKSGAGGRIAAASGDAWRRLCTAPTGISQWHLEAGPGSYAAARQSWLGLMGSRGRSAGCLGAAYAPGNAACRRVSPLPATSALALPPPSRCLPTALRARKTPQAPYRTGPRRPMLAAMSLENEKYVLLTTFRRDGRAVSTPVWLVQMPDGEFGFSTGSESGKAKRLRHTPRVTLQGCDRSGGDAHGPVYDAQASLVTGTNSRRSGPRSRPSTAPWPRRSVSPSQSPSGSAPSGSGPSASA